jgi:hypothetical protein
MHAYEWSEPKAGANKRQYLPCGPWSRFDNFKGVISTSPCEGTEGLARN